MEREINELIEKQKQTLFYYSPYNFIKSIDPELQFNALVKERLLSFYNNSNQFIYQTTKNELEFIFVYEYLVWDTDFFKKKCFKIYTVLYTDFVASALTDAIISFRDYLLKDKNVYIFIDIPSEDILLIQCLGLAGFKMVETRLHYFKDDLAAYSQERYKVRKANVQDVPKIVGVAGNNRNEYDRVHADFEFSKEMANTYLGVYAESAVRGYCDAVLVPAETGLPVDAFLAISDLKDDGALLKCKLTKVVLTAVGPANKGWHSKLVSETIYYARDRGASCVLMTTQSTNRAVFRTSEKLGFKLGGTSHIFSYSK